MLTNARVEFLSQLSQLIVITPSTNILKVAIDGVDGAGKTTLADELAVLVRNLGCDVIRASVDGFHNPRSHRYRLGKDSPEGFFHDSYDYDGLKQKLLDPLSAGGSGLYRSAIFDCLADTRIQFEETQAASTAILLFDGIFLHRPELLGYWDFSIFLDVDFEISIPRGAQRGPGFGSPDPTAESNSRYVEGQKMYLRECEPKNYATVVVDNNILSAPKLSYFDKSSAWQEAITYGIDISQLESNLAFSYQERLQRHESALELATELRRAGEHLSKA